MKGKTKKIIGLCLVLAAAAAVGCAGKAAESAAAPSSAPAQSVSAARQLKTKILFINTSRNPSGNTARMGEEFLAGIPHDTLFLNDYKIYQLGQNFPDDQLADVLSVMEQADTLVFGTPVYWHTMSGGLKTFIDRIYELDRPAAAFYGKKMVFLMQGAAPSQATKEMVPYTMSRVAAQYGMDYLGAATDPSDMGALRAKLEQTL